MLTCVVSTGFFAVVGSTNSRHPHGLTIPRRTAAQALVIHTGDARKQFREKRIEHAKRKT
jgi:hypothetical protein